jgi:hypothetical protein
VSRYLSQLIRQTGVAIAASAAPSPAASAHPIARPDSGEPPSSDANGIEHDARTEIDFRDADPVPAGTARLESAGAPDNRTLRAQSDPTLRVGDAAPETPMKSGGTFATRDTLPSEKSADPEARDRGASNHVRPSAEFRPAAPEPPAAVTDVVAVTGAQEIVRNVMAWIAGDPEPVKKSSPSGSVSEPPAPPVGAPAAVSPGKPETGDGSVFPVIHARPIPPAADPPVRVRGDNPGLPRPAAESEPAAWAVHIGAIHLSIEAPTGTPNSRAVEPRPAPASPAPASAQASQAGASRLRRHYLRPG